LGQRGRVVPVGGQFEFVAAGVALVFTGQAKGGIGIAAIGHFEFGLNESGIRIERLSAGRDFADGEFGVGVNRDGEACLILPFGNGRCGDGDCGGVRSGAGGGLARRSDGDTHHCALARGYFELGRCDRHPRGIETIKGDGECERFVAAVGESEIKCDGLAGIDGEGAGGGFDGKGRVWGCGRCGG